MLRLSKLFIANRGEIASRIIRTAKELGIKTVAVCNESDKYANYIQEADEAVCVSSGTNVFLDMENLVHIAKDHNADAIHPGYGFLSESPLFSGLCENNGIKFVGPSSKAMQLLSSKKDAKDLAIQCGIPVVPGYNGSDQSLSRLKDEVKQIGFPVLLKATMGGGGRGMRILESDSNIDQTITMCSNEAKKHFGDGSLLIEKYLPRTRHIEIQVFGDKHGNYVHFGERECSLQRHYQKIIEEAPCFYLSSEEQSQLYQWAIDLARASNYEGAGTVEFLCDNTGSKRQFYFMEVNTRLQVEHLVSQCINNQVDLVELQLRIAAGESLSDIGVSSYQPVLSSSSSLPPSSIYKKGNHCGRFAMECRVYNEDPSNNYLPGEGTVIYHNQTHHLPHTQVEDNTISIPSSSSSSVSYDPMLLKVITSGNTREETISRMMTALRHTHLYGIPTNIPMLLNALRLEQFRITGADSQTTNEFSKELTKIGTPSCFEKSATIAAYVFATNALNRNDQSIHSGILSPWNQLTNFCNSHSLARKDHLKINGDVIECTIQGNPNQENSYFLTYPSSEQSVQVSLVRSAKSEFQISVDGEIVKSFVYPEQQGKMVIFPVTSEDRFATSKYSVESIIPTTATKTARTSSTMLSDVLCPMPSTVTRVSVKNGDVVKKGDLLLVVEAMKMEHSIVAPKDGVVEMGEITEKQFFKTGQQMLRVV